MNRRIAELRGWQVNEGGLLITPNGGESWPKSKWDNNYPWSNVPDYEHDLNAAMILFVELPELATITIDRFLKQWEVSYSDTDEYAGFLKLGTLNDLSPQALATPICEAWLFPFSIKSITIHKWLIG